MKLAPASTAAGRPAPLVAPPAITALNCRTPDGGETRPWAWRTLEVSIGLSQVGKP